MNWDPLGLKPLDQVDIPSTVNIASTSASAAHGVLFAKTSAYEQVIDGERDVCAKCYLPILHARRVVMQGFREISELHEAWIDVDHRASDCPRGYQHEPAGVPAELTEASVSTWLET